MTNLGFFSSLNRFLSNYEKRHLLLNKQLVQLGQLHDDVILLQLPESLSLLFSCAN